MTEGEVNIYGSGLESDKNEKTKESGEVWLNKEKENAFEEVLNILRDIERLAEEEAEKELRDKGIIDSDVIEKTKEDARKEAIHKSFLYIFNPRFEASGAGPLSLSDIKSLEYAEINSISASQVAGKDITRPLFIFFNTSEFQKFSVKLQGKHGMSSRGLVVPPSGFSQESSLGKTGLIIATAGKEFISHEIRHTIDPNLDKRSGRDKILEELFGYYQEEIIDAKLSQYSHLAKPQDGPWRWLSRTISQDMYYENIKDEDNISLEEYKDLAKQASDAARLVSEKYGHIETQKAILKSNTLKEFIELAKI